MIGDKTSPDPVNRVALDRLGPQGPFDYGQPRARVRLEVPPGSKDMNLWDAMDRACDELALLFAGGNPNDIQYLSSQRNGVWQRNPPDANNRRDTLSSTHHEAGTLWMGTPGNSVTDEWGRLHESDNLYAVGPALLPTLGSPNPMLSGVALARRTADHLIPAPTIPNPEAGFKYLFDGTAKSFKGWLTAGKGQFSLVDGNIVAYPGNDLGLLWYALENFGDFTLRLQFKLARPTGSGNDNSGVFVRFRDPRRRVPDRNNPNVSYVYNNTAFVAVDTGFEIQIDEEARGNPGLGTPDGLDEHRTGAIYAIPVGTANGQQNYQRGPAIAPNQWYEFEIKVAGDTYTVKLKDTLGASFQQTSIFTNIDSFRGKPSMAGSNSGYIGLQSHTGLVSFRNIRIKTA